MRIVAIANQKGGCGKTTTSINFSAVLAELQKKILLIDLDPQGHSTCGLGVDTPQLKNTVYDLMASRGGPNFNVVDFIRSLNRNLFILPSDGFLYSIDEDLAGQPDKTQRLKKTIQWVGAAITDFDYAVIDCPPNLGVLTLNALEACDEVIIPIDPSFFSLHGLARMSETISRVNKGRAIPIQVYALLTLFDSRVALAREVYEDVKKHFDDSLFKTIIHECVALKEAASTGESIVQYDSESLGCKDFFNLGVEYLERQWEQVLPEKGLGWEQIIRRRFGPRQVCGGVLFQAPTKNARCIEIAGDFNNWVPEPMVFRSEFGLWQKIIPLSKGAFRYKFIVDGEWQMDPWQTAQKENAYGSYDSYVEVA